MLQERFEHDFQEGKDDVRYAVDILDYEGHLGLTFC